MEVDTVDGAGALFELADELLRLDRVRALHAASLATAAAREEDGAGGHSDEREHTYRSERAGRHRLAEHDRAGGDRGRVREKRREGGGGEGAARAGPQLGGGA